VHFSENSSFLRKRNFPEKAPERAFRQPFEAPVNPKRFGRKRTEQREKKQQFR